MSTAQIYTKQWSNNIQYNNMQTGTITLSN